MTTTVTVNGNDYTIEDDKPFDANGSLLVRDAHGNPVGVLHTDAAFLVTVPADDDFSIWQNPDPGPKGLLLLRVRDAWKSSQTKKGLVADLHSTNAPDVATLLQAADTLAAAKATVDAAAVVAEADVIGGK